MITCTPTTDQIISCLGCGEQNYRKVNGAIESTGLALFTLSVRTTLADGWESPMSWSHTLCARCLQELNEAIFRHRSGYATKSPEVTK